MGIMILGMMGMTLMGIPLMILTELFAAGPLAHPTQYQQRSRQAGLTSSKTPEGQPATFSDPHQLGIIHLPGRVLLKEKRRFPRVVRARLGFMTITIALDRAEHERHM